MIHRTATEIASWVRNLRFYVLVGAAVLAAATYAIIALTIDEQRLAVIRIEQIYGLLSTIFLYVALLATPLTKSYPSLPFAGQYLHARRAIGVSAFLFGVLHATIAFFWQLQGFDGLAFLSQGYVTALGLGVIGLFILLLMAATSFDIAIEKMGFGNWKRLHQFVYLAGFAVLVHVLLVGSHVDGLLQPMTLALIGATIILVLLEALRIDDKHTKHRRPDLFFGSIGPLTMSVIVGAGMFAASLLISSLVLLDPSTPEPTSIQVHHAGSTIHRGGTR